MRAALILFILLFLSACLLLSGRVPEKQQPLKLTLCDEKGVCKEVVIMGAE